MHRLLGLLVIGLLPTLAAAHDFWIAPTDFRPAVGQAVGLHLKVGENGVGEAVPRYPALVKQFIGADSTRRETIPGRAGADPAGQWRAPAAGLHTIGYHSHASRVELPADKFDAYLAAEGLDAVRALRAQAAPIDRPVREMFSRDAKSLLQVGSAEAAQSDTVLGLPLELVAEHNPYALAAGAALPLRLLYQGQALSGALVTAINLGAPSERFAQRSDAQGRVSLPLRSGAAWLVKAVHMVPAEAGSDADWASHWASLSFSP